MWMGFVRRYLAEPRPSFKKLTIRWKMRCRSQRLVGEGVNNSQSGGVLRHSRKSSHPSHLDTPNSATSNSFNWKYRLPSAAVLPKHLAADISQPLFL